MSNYIDNGRCIRGHMTSADFKKLVDATGMTHTEFYNDFMEDQVAEITFKRWITSSMPSAAILSHLTSVYHELYVLARVNLKHIKEQ